MDSTSRRLWLEKIIVLKNSVAYDSYIGGVTTSFFPINLLMLFFMPVIVTIVGGCAALGLSHQGGVSLGRRL